MLDMLNIHVPIHIHMFLEQICYAANNTNVNTSVFRYSSNFKFNVNEKQTDVE